MTARKIERTTAKLTDEGRLIEAGWVELREGLIAEGSPPWQVEGLRTFYFAGAAHCFASIRDAMQGGKASPEQVRQHMGQIEDELKSLVRTYELRNQPAKGSA